MEKDKWETHNTIVLKWSVRISIYSVIVSALLDKENVGELKGWINTPLLK